MIKKMTYYKSKNELELEEARKAQNKKIRELEEEIDNRKDEYKKVIDRENERVYNCNEYYAETMETRRKNMELKEENQKLKEEKQELEYLGDINEELKEENKKLKERIAELEKCNLNLQEHIDKLFKS